VKQFTGLSDTVVDDAAMGPQPLMRTGHPRTGDGPSQSSLGLQEPLDLASHSWSGVENVNDSDAPRDRSPTFEETFPRYEFADLVRLCILIGAWLGGFRFRRNGESRARVTLRRERRPTAPAS